MKSHQPRPYQSEVPKALAWRRFICLLWRRQAGKSTELSKTAVSAMLAYPGLTVTYASASLLLGREIVFKQAQLMAATFRGLLGQNLQTVDSRTGKALPVVKGAELGFDVDALAECFEAQRLEFRVRHDKSTVSRTMVIAPNPATARGWTGWVMLDEFGFIRDFRDLWEAVEPIISTDPEFRLVMATTPPRDDTHYSYELTAPPLGTIFPSNAAGNWYESQALVPVHRVDIFDAHLAGVKLYDLRTGKELTPEEHFAAADDKDAWRRNYKCEHVLGGTSACGILQLDSAQARGRGQCRCFVIDSDDDFEAALVWLAGACGDGALGLGLDLASTEKETSNPSCLAVAERRGQETIFRAMLVWKTKNPRVMGARVEAVVRALARHVRRPRMLCVDASNERLWAEGLRSALAALLPVRCIAGADAAPNRFGEALNMKQYLGQRLVGELDDNHLWLPPERYVREDWRLVKRERGLFACQADGNGRHGDTFDAAKLALQSLTSPEARMPLVFRRAERD